MRDRGPNDPRTGTSETGPVARLRAEADRAQEDVQQAKEQYRAAVDARRGGPAKDPDDAAATMARLRADMDRDVADLRLQLAGSSAPRTAAFTAAGIVGLGVVVGVLGRFRARRAARREHEEAVDEQARALARALRRLDATTPHEGS